MAIDIMGVEFYERDIVWGDVQFYTDNIEYSKWLEIVEHYYPDVTLKTFDTYLQAWVEDDFVGMFSISTSWGDIWLQKSLV